MDNYSEKAKANFREGYNCSQAVLLTFADEVNIDKDTILRLSSSFGGGMGKLREVCGAVSSMFMVAGFLDGYVSPTDNNAKVQQYSLVQELATAFKTKNNTIICRELLDPIKNDGSPVPEARTDAYYKERPCEKFVGDAAEIIGKYITRRKNNENSSNI